MYIAIAGNIGSGKTTLTQILTKRYDAKCYLEECDNPYIGDFYEDMNRWAFNLQISFLGSRIQQTMGMISDCKSGVIFQDRTIYEDAHIFADNLHPPFYRQFLARRVRLLRYRPHVPQFSTQ